MKESFYEEVKNKTECSECGNKDMGIAYVHDNKGAVKKKGKTLGMDSFTPTGNLLLIMCKQCGFVAKSFGVPR